MLFTPSTNLLGTGIFICKGNDTFLLTANHVQEGLDKDSLLIMADENADSTTIPLINLINASSWKIHPVADMAVVHIDISNYLALFTKRFFPYSQIDLGHTCFTKDREVNSVGFPNGLGVGGKFSPLTFRSYVSSNYLTMQRGDKPIYSDFFCLENPSVGGYSGGPVLDLGYVVSGYATSFFGDTRILGIVHGTISDNTGGKIALITPMYYLSDIL